MKTWLTSKSANYLVASLFCIACAGKLADIWIVLFGSVHPVLGQPIPSGYAKIQIAMRFTTHAEFVKPEVAELHNAAVLTMIFGIVLGVVLAISIKYAKSQEAKADCPDTRY